MIWAVWVEESDDVVLELVGATETLGNADDGLDAQ